MRLDSNGVVLESSGKFTESEFTIGDPRLILEYLRKSVYSNPKRVLVQELMSNARDAHKEVGKEDSPIVVTIPTTFNLNWSVTDYGPGINPSRMKEVFIQFGVSTKRGVGEHATDDGSQMIGGFGIGSKSPWAYTDSFTIITKAKEGDDIVERTYIAIIGEDRRNKLMEFDGSKRICDPGESTGTTITVPVQIADIYYFDQYTVEVSQYWSVRPQLKNSSHNYEDREVIFNGPNWRVLKKSSQYDQNKVVALVGQIPYNVNLNSINNFPDNLRRMFDASIVMEFNIGDLSVALSRENLQYDDRTQKAIVDRMTDIYANIEAEVSKSLVNCDSLWKAKVHWRKLCNSTEIAKVIGGSTWNGHKINNEPIHVPWSDYRVQTFPRSGKRGANRRHITSEIVAHDTTMLVYSSEQFDRVPANKIRYLLETNKNLDSIQLLIKKNQQQTIETMEFDKLLPLLDAVDLVKVDVPKVKREYYRLPTEKVDGYIFRDYGWRGTTIDFTTLNYDEVVIVDMLRKNARYMSCEQMSTIKKMMEHVASIDPSFKAVKFIGIPTNKLHKVKKLEQFNDFVTRLLNTVIPIYAKEYEDVDFVNRAKKIREDSHVSAFTAYVWGNKEYKAKIDTNSDMYKFMSLLDAAENIKVSKIDYKKFFDVIGSYTKECQLPTDFMSKKLEELNTLLQSVNDKHYFIMKDRIEYYQYDSDRRTEKLNHIINYINRM